MKASSLFLLLFLCGPLSAFGQAPAPPGPASSVHDRGWFAFGLGAGEPYGTAVVGTANFGRTRFVQVGFHASTELHLLGGRSASVNALHLGGGLSRVSRWDRVALAAGPAVVWGLRDATDTDSRYATAGVVLSGQAIFTPIPEVGLGLDAFVNVNPVRSAYGVGLTFVFEANK